MFSTVRVVREHTQFFDDTEDLIVWSFISTGTFCRTWKISFDLVFTRPLTRSLFYVCLKLEFYFWLRLFVFVSFTFPDMRTLGHGLAEVLDALQIPYVIGLGEGAGANILARLGMERNVSRRREKSGRLVGSFDQHLSKIIWPNIYINFTNWGWGGKVNSKN